MLRYGWRTIGISGRTDGEKRLRSLGSEGAIITFLVIDNDGSVSMRDEEEIG